jgi:flagellar biosynthesis protein
MCAAEMTDQQQPKDPVRAVALRHDRSVPAAPEVLAQGTGEVAKRILELAAKEGIPVRQDPDLVELLAAVEIGQEIPVELYEAVAALLAFLYQLSSAGEAGDCEH